MAVMQVSGCTDGLGQVEAAVEVGGAVPESLASGDRGGVTGGKPKPVEQQQGVGGRGPFRAVEGSGPGAVGILGCEQACAPALGGNGLPFGVDDLGRGVVEVGEHLPADRGITVEQPAAHVDSGRGDLDSVPYAELDQQARDVRFHGAQGQVHLCSDFGVGAGRRRRCAGRPLRGG